MKFDARTRLFLLLSAVFVTCLVVGDIIGGKLVQTSIAGHAFTLTVGMIPFPVTFLLTDLLNEFYGKRAARMVTWIGFAMAALAYVFIFIAGAIPIAALTREAGWAGVTDEAFNRVFLSSQRMILASLTAYLIAQLVDIWVFHALRQRTGSRLLWLRATGSTAVSQMVDTVAINLVAWVGLLSTGQIVNIVVSSYVLKLGVAVLLTPLIYAGHSLMERVFGVRSEAETTAAQ